MALAAQPTAKVSAVVAVSAGLVACFSLPASAGPHLSAQPAAAPLAALVNQPDTVAAARAVPALALCASAADALSTSGLVSPTFGDIGLTGIVKPKPKPVVVHRVVHTVVHRTVQVHAKPTVHTQPQHSSRSAVRHAVVRHQQAPVHHTVHHSAPPASSGVSHSGVLAVAARYAGVPYVYGGSSPSGFDCSGFTSYVFRQIGISLPRTAHAQQAAVPRVSSPQPGDLVFFGSPAYHVGIYAGGGKMWDAPHTGSSVGLHTVYGGVSSYGRP